MPVLKTECTIYNDRAREKQKRMHVKNKQKKNKKTIATTTSTALVWQTNLSSMSVTGIFSLKTVNDLTESITHFHRLLMNEV